MKKHNYFVYIMTNKHNTVLYTGISNDLVRRVWEHKNKYYPTSYTAKYNINKLVYYEYLKDVNLAIIREKQIKSGSREKKLWLIEKMNKEWKDLSDGI